MNDPSVVDILDCREDGANELCSIAAGRRDEIVCQTNMANPPFIVIPLGTDPIEKLPTRTQVETQVQVMRRLRHAVTRLRDRCPCPRTSK